MTLIIFNKCINGSILILDRKETDVSGIGQETKKYFFPKNKQFILALAGETLRIETIFSALELDKNVDATSITQKLDEIIHKIPIFSGSMADSVGLLLVKQSDSWEFHHVWFTNNNYVIERNDPRFKCYGDGSILTDYLMRKFNLDNLPWQESLSHLIAIMQEVSTTIDSVGDIQKFGFDIFVFTKDEIKSGTIRNLGSIKNIMLDFQPIANDETENLLQTIPTGEISEKSKLEIGKPNILKPLITNMHEDKEIEYSDKIHIIDEKGTFDLSYSMQNGKLLNVVHDSEAFSLIFTLSATKDGKTSITIPRELLDAKYRDQDDTFFVLVDGEEIDFDELKTDTERTLTIQFPEGAEEIEVIGTEASVSTDKKVYTYGEKIILTISDYEQPDELPVNLTILNNNGKIIFQKPIDAKLIHNTHQENILIAGQHWRLPNQKYLISVKFKNKTISKEIKTDSFSTSILLDQKVYSWNDRVKITVIAPELVRDFSKTESIGNSVDQDILIITSMGSLEHYRLNETGIGTGIFVGSVRLTGFKGHEAKLHDSDKNSRGGTFGAGPDDGSIACSNADAITVKLRTTEKTISGSAIIRWNIGIVNWMSGSYPVVSVGKIRLVDPDIGLNPDAIDKVEIKIWSDTDPNGILISMLETSEDSGIFNGDVYFTKDESNSPKLKVSEGDTVTAEYADKTLPEPYTKKNELIISATTAIGTLLPPLQRISINYAMITDSFGNHLATISTGQPVLVMTEIQNDQDKSENFALIMQVQDEHSTSVSLSSISGILESKQKLSPALSWIAPREGKYNVTLWVWKSLDNPHALSPPVELEIFAVGDEKEIPSPKSFQLKAPDDVTKNISKHFDCIIQIPQGSSEPGCQDMDECYIPSNIKVKIDETVLWTNNDNAGHTVTSGTPDSGHDGEFDSGVLVPEKSFAHTFKKKGIFHYFCMIHPWQIGKIEVK